MKNKRYYKDITNINEELSKIMNDFNSIDNKMIAIGLDYKQYIDSSFNNKEIYILRDSIQYRLRATKLHIQILVNLLENLDNELSNIHTQNKNGGIGVHMHFANRILDISALFDSVIFHIVSTFDYVSILVNFIVSGNQKKLKWTNLAKSVRDKTNELSKTNFSNKVDELDRFFVGNLYNYRSHIIHRSNENGKKSSFSIQLLKGKVETKIISSSAFNKNFSELRELSKENDLSISYVLFWLLKKTNTSIIEIQYGLKEFMENNKKNDKPFMFLKGPNNETLPVSHNHWK